MATGIFKRWLLKWRDARLVTAPRAEDEQRALADYVNRLESVRSRLEEESYTGEAVYDRTLMTLGGGALAVSVAFLKDIAPDPIGWTITLLALSWLSLLLGVLCTVTSMLTSQWAFEASLTDLDRQIREAAGHPPSPTEESEDVTRQCRRYAQITRRLNHGAASLIGVGSVLFLAFAVANMALRVDTGCDCKESTAIAPPGREKGTSAEDARSAEDIGGRIREGGSPEAGESGARSPATQPLDAGRDTKPPLPPRAEAEVEQGGADSMNKPGYPTTTTPIPDKQGGVVPKPATPVRPPSQGPKPK